MKKILFLILLINIVSCTELEKNGIKIIIVNNTDKTLKNIRFYTSEKIALVSIGDIKPTEKSEMFYVMKEHKIDGSYLLEFTKNDSIYDIIDSGYYSNGFSTDESVEYDIRNDTTLINYTHRFN